MYTFLFIHAHRHFSYRTPLKEQSKDPSCLRTTKNHCLHFAVRPNFKSLRYLNTKTNLKRNQCKNQLFLLAYTPTSNHSRIAHSSLALILPAIRHSCSTKKTRNKNQKQETILQRSICSCWRHPQRVIVQEYIIHPCP
jgi:hypothetical protein